MARFKADVKGGRGQASRLGHATSGIWSWTRGWNTGIEVQGRVEDDKDVFYVYATGGSGSSHMKLIGRLDEGGNFVLK
tara:strand:- start:1202 stop:1435 length:234 start_codon:yes stop_codon:yes gene_type:complete